MSAEIGMQLARFVTETKYTNIPKDVVEFTKALTLKTVAGTLAGATRSEGKKMAKLIRDHKLPEEIGIIGCGFKTSLWEGTFLNAFLAHASELEDDRWRGGGVSSEKDDRLFYGSSWDITVIPLLLSLAQKLRLSGRALVEALVVGLEAHVRTTLFSANHLGVGFVSGAAGPAMAGARALGLGVKETASALGLATSGVPLSFHNFSTSGHFFESALQSLQGIMAAEMAKEGMTGNPDIALYLCNFLGKDRVLPEKMVEGLGSKWLLCGTWIKKYPCCFGTHRQIDALLDVKKEHNLSYEDVQTVEVHMSSAGFLTSPYLNRPEPKTEPDLQFSMQHVLGAALVDGDVNLEHVSEPAITDRRLKEARSKVKVIVHDEWSGLMTRPARITVKTKDGRQFSKERNYSIGAPEEPLTTEQYLELYRKFTRGILSPKQITKTAEAILNLEKLTDADVEELMDMLTLGRCL